MAEGFPSWRYGPNGQSAVFDCAEDVPAGFVDHPSKLKGGDPSTAGEVDPFDHDGDGKPGGSRRKKAVSNGPRK